MASPNTGPTAGAGGGAGAGAASAGNGGSSVDGGGAGADPNLPAWTDVTGDLAGRSNSGGGVVYVSAKPDEPMLIAGVAGDGLWGSTDGGMTWNALGQTGASDMITNLVNSIVYDPDHPEVFWETGIYVGGGLYRSDDDGKTIVELGGNAPELLPLTDQVRHNDLVSVDFTDAKRRTLLVGGHEQKQRLYLSQDTGKTWSMVGDTIPIDAGFSSFPQVIDAQNFLVGVSNQILRSADGGASWTTVSKVGGWNPPAQTPDGSIYWQIENYAGVMRSDDQGLTWNRAVGAGISSGPLIALPDGSLASQTATNVIVSRDRGVSWTVVSSAFPFVPSGLTYSVPLKAFFTWITSGKMNLPGGSIMRYDWDYQTQ